MADLDGTGIVEGERLLAQRSVGWKVACSLWVVVVAIGFVMFSVLGWALGAMLSRSRKMWVWTLVWAVLYGFAAFAMERMNDASDVGVTIFIVIWVASIAHAAYLSRGVLRARAVALARDRGWRAAAVAPPQPDLPTIPLPEGVSRQRGGLRD